MMPKEVLAADGRLVFAFAVHDHQPVGNFDEVIARAHVQAYAPFLRAIQDHPDLHFSLHVSGSLLEWMEENAAGTVGLVGELAARGQCEILGGTYYEALAPVAPAHDVSRSVAAYADKLARLFGARPEGMWLAERVYEPHLPALLADAGVKHTALDDWHFRAAGLGQEDLVRPWLAEHQGKRVTVCPISQRLRYMVPFAPVANVVAYLRDLHNAGAPMACLADDGEKFGEWPGTHDHCYAEGWVETFFAALDEASPWLRVATLGEAVRAIPAAGPAYLPATAYYEMTRWALPAEAQRRLTALGADFDAGGVYGDLATGAPFRSFFQKYPEINFFHKRVQGLSARIEERGDALGEEGEEIRRDLWRAQANDSYWHGVFGGFYLPHLRRGVKTAFVKAEVAFDRAVGETERVGREDLDADGGDEITLANARVVAVLKAREGLAVAEFTSREPPLVLTDVPARRPEAYHNELQSAEGAERFATIHAPRASKEPGLEEYLVYDRGPRRFFRERAFAAGADAWAYAREAAPEWPAAAWEAPTRRGRQWLAPGVLVRGGTRLRLAKGVALLRRGLSFTLEAEGEVEEPFILGWEFALNLRSETPDHSSIEGGRKFACDAAFGCEPERRWVIADALAGWALAVDVEAPLGLWHVPVYTVSCSESGYEKVYQGASFFLGRELAAGSARFAWRVTANLA